MFLKEMVISRRADADRKERTEIEARERSMMCCNGGNTHKFGPLSEEQPVDINFKDGALSTLKFKGILRKLNIDKKTPVFIRCEWCGKIVTKKV